MAAERKLKTWLMVDAQTRGIVAQNPFAMNFTAETFELLTSLNSIAFERMPVDRQTLGSV